MKKYTKTKYRNEELLMMDAIDVYILLLDGKINRFPPGFWQQPEAKENGAICTRYLIEEILKYDKEMIKKNNSAQIYEKYKLNGMMKTCFNASPYETINNAYPNEFKEWEFNNTPMRYWKDKDNCAKATKWLIEEKLKLTDEELKKELSIKIFQNNGLHGLLSEFQGSVFKIINNAYPDKFKEWEFKMVPSGFWNNKEHSEKATKWLIEDKLKLTDDELKENLSAKLFSENGLSGLLSNCYNNSPYEAINSAYPDKFKEWEFKSVPQGYWDNKENGIKATKWLIEEKLKLNNEQIKEELSQKLFIDNSLIRMLQHCFNGSPYEAINNLYPGKFKEWEFKCVPNRYWNKKENGIKATRWLIEEKLKLSDEQIKEQVCQKLFKDNGLTGMLQHCFKGNLYDAINSVYPNKFKEWEFKRVVKGYWDNKENGIKATRWLIEEKLKLSDEQIKEQLCQKLFVDNGLSGMLQHCFNSNCYEAINSVYPNKFKEWEFKSVSKGYWDNKENSIKAIKWLIEEKLKLDDEQLKEQLSNSLFKKNGLNGMLNVCFKDSSYEAINTAYPNKFKKSDFKGYSKWNKI